MPSVPISQFEHRVARWASRLKKNREPLEISQHGYTSLVVLDKDTFEEWKADRERLQALEILLLVQEGERAIAKGRVLSHEAVGRRFGLAPRKKKRRS